MTILRDHNVNTKITSEDTMADVMERPTKRATTRERRDLSIHVRTSPKTRDLIERAAEVSGKTMTDFVLDSATQHATDVLLDQRLFMLGQDQHEAFMRALDNPPTAGPKLKALMKRRPAGEK
jgi:uncharacterized protein (DUF1778 family)